MSHTLNKLQAPPLFHVIEINFLPETGSPLKKFRLKLCLIKVYK